MGKGLWPAFWMLGTNIDQVSWPRCGEIDVMEHINNNPKINGTAHWDNVGHNYMGGVIDADVTEFHNYTVIWDSLAIKWYMDETLYFQLNIANGVNGTEEFQLPFYLLLNLAVGGNWPGYPDATTVFPAEMAVDYVRVYEFDPFASISELNSESLKFYPNPASEHLIFKNPTFDEVTVFSLDGKLIAEKQLIANSINISNLESGIYLISVNSKNGNKITKRFVKN
jgi:beta-glucanase (GH16 family)